MNRIWLVAVLIIILVACGAPPLPDSPDASSVQLPTVEQQQEGAEVVDSAESSPVIAVEDQATELVSSGDEETHNGLPVGFTEDGNAYIGSLDAPVVIHEYSDFQCPYCQRFHIQTLSALLENEVANGEAVLIFNDFPLSIHPQAEAAANAARCAGEEGPAAYWAMHDALFDNFGSWSLSDPTTQFVSYATDVGLDTVAFTECQNEMRFANKVQSDLRNGEAAGIRGTPGFIINGEILSGAQPYGAFAQAIDRAIAGEPIVQAPPTPDLNDIDVEEPEPFELSDNFAGAMGDPNAPVVIVEFTDYQCPYCQRHSTQTLPTLVQEYIDTGRVYYIMKDLPLDQIHPLARDAAVAARCAGQQDVYWEMHDLLFEQQQAWANSADLPATFASYAEQLNLDGTAFSACLNDSSIADAIQENFAEANSMGISGTPFFFVNGYPVINGAQSIDVFEQGITLAEDGELVNAIMDAQRRQLAAQQQQQQVQQPPAPTEPVEVPIDSAFAIGNPDAPVTIVEYTDYQCPYCSRHYSQTFGQLKSQYVDTGEVYYVFKDFPLEQIHPQARTAAFAARCAGEQDAFLEMHGSLFSRQQEWNGRSDAADIFSSFASDLGLDVAAFDTCLDSQKYNDAVQADLDEGIGFGVRGTPAFFVNGTFVNGAQPFGAFQQAIQTAQAATESQ